MTPEEIKQAQHDYYESYKRESYWFNGCVVFTAFVLIAAMIVFTLIFKSCTI